MLDSIKHTNIYSKSIKYFSDELDLVVSLLKVRRCVVLASAYKMGDRRFVDYVASKLQFDDSFEIYYDKENTYTIETLKQIQKRDSQRIKVILLPWYFRMNLNFTKEYIRLMRNRSATFVSVLVLDANFLDTPEKYFPDTNIPMDVVMTRKPLSHEKSLQMIKLRCEIDNISIPVSKIEEIIKLSGGHIGLIKRMCMFYQIYHSLNIEELISEPTIRVDLLQLEHQLRTLSNPTLQRIGLIDTNKRYKIPLLKLFTESINKDNVQSMKPTDRILFEFFNGKQDKIVNLKEVHELFNSGKPFTMWGTYKVISRFSSSIGPRYRVVNVKGKGYKLIET